MRTLFIAAGILVFLLYCWASVVRQNLVDVPAYRDVEIDLLGGVSRDAWDRDQQARFQRLMRLETQRYQPPLDQPDADKPLVSDDFEAYIARHPGSPVMMKLRDSGEFTALLARNYLLRDTIRNPANPDNPNEQPIYSGGIPLDKAMLDDLHVRGFRTIAITGRAAPVNFQLGTAIMTAVIFFTLVAALKPVLWEPFTAMLEKRRRELEIGGEAERQNQQEAIRFEEEKRRRNAGALQQANEQRLRGQRETALAAGAIVREARDREKGVKLAGLRDMGLAAERARAEIEQRIPELALAVADAIMPGKDAPQPHDPGRQQGN